MAYGKEITVGQLWTDWDVTSDAPADTVADRVVADGEYEMSSKFNQQQPSATVDVSLPDRYVGGEYVLDIVARNAYGDEVETIATLTID